MASSLLPRPATSAKPIVLPGELRYLRRVPALLEAIGEGRKTQARFLVHVENQLPRPYCQEAQDSHAPNEWEFEHFCRPSALFGTEPLCVSDLVCPYEVGEVLLVETHRVVVTATRLERLQDITEEDAEAEGIPSSLFDFMGCSRSERCWVDPADPALLEGDIPHLYGSARLAFVQMWNTLCENDTHRCFFANPWVWVAEFTLAPVVAGNKEAPRG